mmetsp:Transcript_20098/g.60956  ORF Transcript_20098/g.60956 Transcript_20098/m.60956 type:complete len:408 (-) Transcript_20098:2238-3461(-)
MGINNATNYLFSTARGLAVLMCVAAFMEPSLAIVYDDTEKFTWVVVFAGILAFLAAYGIGANDVANAFATSVGAKSLTISQAVVLAAIFEFLGAVLMGSSVAKTIRKGIAEPDCFEDNPGLLMYGMTIVILTVAVWLVVASYFEMPVSTTHSAVGGIIGMTMMVRGSDCVIWNEEEDEFPYISGVSAIVLSWVLSPVASGVCAAVIYGLTKFLILPDRTQSFWRAQIGFPVIVAFTCAVNSAFIVIKGSKGKAEEWGTDDIVTNAKEGDGSKLTILAAIVFGVTLVIAGIMTPFLAKNIRERVPEGLEYDPTADTSGKSTEMVKKPSQIASDDDAESGGIASSAISYVKTEINANPHDALTRDESVSAIHANAEAHDAQTEEMFKFVQVFTAIVDAFSHGANVSPEP